MTETSKQNVVSCKGGNFINVLGVLQQTEAKLIRAQRRINLRTHRCKTNQLVKKALQVTSLIK